MPGALPLAVVIVYALCLFAFASWAEGHSNADLKRRLRVPAYALALAVYCTSWTYYGAVGSAVADGWSYLPIYLGPILIFVFGHSFLRKLIDAVKSDGANSISEFIGGRFGKSQSVAALVTILALLGSIPYLALQLRSLGTTYTLISGGGDSSIAMGVAAVGLALFTMVYGTRRYEAAGRNDAVLFAVGFESLLKLGALLVAGVIAIVLLAQSSQTISDKGILQLARNFEPSNIGIDFFVITLLSMAAILCLPRQFYMTVIEAESPGDINRARWPFVGYMVATLLVVFPISAAGLSLLPTETRPDLYVLQLPLSQQLTLPTILIFLGGFSAATAMVLVETIALSTMISNDLVAPLLVRSERLKGEGDLGRALLTTRRLAMAAIMLAALGWALGIADNQRLASIGLVAFAAMAQFAPALILAVLGGNRDASAAKAGLLTGLLVWIYTLAMPQMAGEYWLGGLRGTFADPNALLGIDGLSPISHGAIWSIGANLVAFSLVTMRRVQTGALPGLLRNTYPDAAPVSNIRELKAVVARFVGPESVADAFAGLSDEMRIDRANTRKAERLIAGVVGLPSARAFLRSALYGSNLTHDEVARILDDTGQSLRFSKGLLAATLENIDPGVSVVDRDLNIVAWNSRYLEMFEYPADKVKVGAPVADLIRYNAERGECGPGEVEAHVEKRLGHMRNGLAHSFERIRPDGRVLKTVGGPMPSGGYVMCFTDVTAEAQALAALERARIELEMRVANRTSELQAANNALAEADSEKTRFLAAASHDLLQPIHAARLFAAALGRQIPDAQGDILGKLDRSIESADTLLRALLDISRLDAGGVTPEPKPLQLRALLAEMAETFAPLAREKGLSIRIGPSDAVVETDAGLLRSVIQNLLSNAIRYTQDGGIVIGVRRRGNSARIDVIDTGPGIPIDKQQRIFREFERLANAHEGGIGLGLAIVERIARVLGARVSLRSEEGRGSRFSISLPMSNAQPELATQIPLRDGTSDKRLSVMVVDDDLPNCEAMESYLAALGHDISRATSARDALKFTSHFDVALIDFNLGDKEDGLWLIGRLRERYPDARYALVTAARPTEYSARAKHAAVPVLRKPVSASELEQWLQQAMGTGSNRLDV
jgi:Na+/proline symporter/signal transduction histidine kinase/ActR/RegA family two-component response regulator